MRRNIPLDSLRIFEAAARYRSFTEAAARLGLSQGAVSQRIQNLEAMLETPLFRRLPRAVVLTPQGEALAKAVARGLAEIEHGLDELMRKQKEKRAALRLSVLNSLAVCWLMPRLDRMGAELGYLQIALLVDDNLQEIGIEADLGLRLGRGHYPGLKSEKLCDHDLFPVCSPDFLAAHPEAHLIGDPDHMAEWQSLPFLVDTTAETDGSGWGWSDWARALGIEWELWPAAAFNYSHLVLQAAQKGNGIALASHVLAADALAEGHLVRLGTRTIPSKFDYYLVSPTEFSTTARQIASWLKRELHASLQAEIPLAFPPVGGSMVKAKGR